MAFTFLKTGTASTQLAKKAAVEAAVAREEQGKLFRFWLKEAEECRITFVDGDLTEEGFLCPSRYYEHNLYLEGKWGHTYVCPVKTMPETKDTCPICESGDKPTLVALFTIIDHRSFPSRDKTKVYKDTKKLLVAKPQTFEMLNKIATKIGGLAGATFDVSRGDRKTASVGSLFIFIEKKPAAELKPLYVYEKVDPKTNLKVKVSNFEVADYEKEIVFRDGKTLRELLMGMNTKAGMEALASAGATGEQPDYSDQL